jgi:hypothetical protein
MKDSIGNKSSVKMPEKVRPLHGQKNRSILIHDDWTVHRTRVAKCRNQNFRNNDFD